MFNKIFTMQKYIYILIPFLILSCNKKLNEEINDKKTSAYKTNPSEKKDSIISEGITGLWFGKFDLSEKELKARKEINNLESEDRPQHLLSFTYINPSTGYWEVKPPNSLAIEIYSLNNDSSFTGRSICAGNIYEIEGKFSKLRDQSYHFQGKEIGEGNNKGTFDFKIFEGTAIGYWISDSNKKKTFGLSYINFVYDKNAGQDQLLIETNPSVSLLNSSHIENLRRHELRIIRNTIFARHGMSFTSSDLRNYFESKDWYIPHTKDVNKDLTPVEIKNIALINRYEAYAEDTFQEFGR